MIQPATTTAAVMMQMGLSSFSHSVALALNSCAAEPLLWPFRREIDGVLTQCDYSGTMPVGSTGTTTAVLLVVRG